MNTFFTTTENARWMLVDDNQEFLTALAGMIEEMTSAEVECHNSPESALAAFAATPGKYKLIITDFEMPEMDGVKLCRQMCEISPTQEIFLMTASEFFTEETAWCAGFRGLLQKPFSLAALQNLLAGAGICGTETALA